MIKGLSMAARAVEVGDQGEIDHATTILLQRHPEYKVMPRPNPAAVPMLRITPEIVSILDYAKGFGHADLVRVTDSDLAEYIESRRHHWAGHRAREAAGDSTSGYDGALISQVTRLVSLLNGDVMTVPADLPRPIRYARFQTGWFRDSEFMACPRSDAARRAMQFSNERGGKAYDWRALCPSTTF
jgi:hypothetical protein